MSDAETSEENAELEDPAAAAAERWKSVVEGGHYLSDATEAGEVIAELTPFAEALEGFAEWMGPVGIVASVVGMSWSVLDAENAGVSIHGNAGMCYGVVCAAGGYPFPAWPHPDMTQAPVPSDDELASMKDAFESGLQTGKSQVSDPALHNRVGWALAKNGPEPELNALWQQVAAGHDPGASFHLGWPQASIGS